MEAASRLTKRKKIVLTSALNMKNPIENPQEDGSMDTYECTVCGYVYDPDEGDPDNGIDPGTAFEDLPDDWVCPVCGASKDQFEIVE